MKYCVFCKRINPGRPVHCQYCGRTFGSRICRHCREANPPEALTCRNCGSTELSETSGPIPLWPVLLNIKFVLWIFAFILIVELIKNLDILLSFLIIGVLWGVGFLFMPQSMKKIVNRIFKYFWNLIRKNIE
jgi:RNA polymerase subunit RPABC4/transcription elongation factor Spt4